MLCGSTQFKMAPSCLERHQVIVGFNNQAMPSLGMPWAPPWQSAISHQHLIFPTTPVNGVLAARPQIWAMDGYGES